MRPALISRSASLPIASIRAGVGPRHRLGRGNDVHEAHCRELLLRRVAAAIRPQNCLAIGRRRSDARPDRQQARKNFAWSGRRCGPARRSGRRNRTDIARPRRMGLKIAAEMGRGRQHRPGFWHKLQVMQHRQHENIGQRQAVADDIAGRRQHAMSSSASCSRAFGRHRVDGGAVRACQSAVSSSRHRQGDRSAPALDRIAC